jgi:hypothetical protein
MIDQIDDLREELDRLESELAALRLQTREASPASPRLADEKNEKTENGDDEDYGGIDDNHNHNHHHDHNHDHADGASRSGAGALHFTERFDSDGAADATARARVVVPRPPPPRFGAGAPVGSRAARAGIITATRSRRGGGGGAGGGQQHQTRFMGALGESFEEVCMDLIESLWTHSLVQ